MHILVVNAGSSSLKLRLLGDGDELIAAEDVPAPGGKVDPRQLADFARRLSPIDVVGHRIVHGGERFRDAVLIDAEVECALRELTNLAPLHQPKSLAALDAASVALPGVPAVACFDTAFHATMPEAATTYALPSPWRERYGLRRYGFHGLSHAHASRRAAEMLDRSDLRLVTCHLGAGASLAAVHAGICRDTTMGFTPLEGLVMATRSGSVDPGLLLWLLERQTMSEREMGAALEHDSGLLGLAGTPDMSELIARAQAGEAKAQLAFDVYVHRLRSMISAMAASIEGLDALVFTGGVGENAPEVRAAAAQGLDFLGVTVESERNAAPSLDARIAGQASRAEVLVIAAREDLEIARQVRNLLAGD